jgi:hypothetical protein
LIEIKFGHLNRVKIVGAQTVLQRANMISSLMHCVEHSDWPQY